MDELSPLFHEIEFHERFRGYDPDEVDAYVDRVAKAAALVQGRIAELHSRAEAAETRLAESGGSETEDMLRRTLVLAQRTADAAVAEAREQADRLVGDAEAKAQTTITLADARAEAQLSDAEDRSGRMLAEAETDRRQLLAEAEANATTAATEARARIEADVQELARTRDFLRDDIDILERHLREQRARLVSSVATLSDLLEAPDALRVEVAPETSGIEPPPVAAFASFAEEPATVVDEPVAVHEPVPVDEPVPDEQPVAVDEPVPDEQPVAVDELVPVDEPVPDEQPVGLDESVDVDEPVGLDEPVEAMAAVVPDPAVLDDAVLPDEPVDDAPIDEGADGDPVDASLIDLTIEAEQPTSAGAPGPSGYDEIMPPRLVTAADVGSEPGAVGAMVDAGPATVPVPVMEAENSLFLDDAADEHDPFLAQLRDAVAGDERPVDEEAMSAFFDDEDDDTDRSWFGRRR